MALRPNTARDELPPKVFGPLGADVAEVNSHLDPARLLTISDYLAGGTER